MKVLQFIVVMSQLLMLDICCSDNFISTDLTCSSFSPVSLPNLPANVWVSWEKKFLRTKAIHLLVLILPYICRMIKAKAHILSGTQFPQL